MIRDVYSRFRCHTVNGGDGLDHVRRRHPFHFVTIVDDVNAIKLAIEKGKSSALNWIRFRGIDHGSWPPIDFLDQGRPLMDDFHHGASPFRAGRESHAEVEPPVAGKIGATKSRYPGHSPRNREGRHA